MSPCSQRSLQKFIIFMLVSISPFSIYGQESGDGYNEGCKYPFVAIKSNLLHDALLTPDIGVELSVSPAISIGIEGVYAWWSNNRAHRYWRIRGLWLDASWWFGKASKSHRLTGHHAGIYASIHDYDFEFGGKGWQSRRATPGIGLTYGYSFRLNRHLNLDLYARVGYAECNVTKYKPMCGTYTCIRKIDKHYFGLTGLGISLTWFPWQYKSTISPR